MLKCKIVGKNRINGIEEEYKIAEGAIFIENFNETLDSGTIILPQLTHEIDIEPYDEMIIWSTSDSKVQINQRRLLVDTYTSIQTCLSPVRYKYEISLFSETKELEGILLPCLSITKLFSGTPRTVYYYLNEYLDKYNKAGNRFSFGHNIKDINDTVASRFGAIDCPELQWNSPTLREVITDLMMVDDCIPIVQNNVINFMDISPSSSDVTEITSTQKKGINFIKKSASSADYVSEIRSELKNSMGDEIILCNDFISFRNYDTYLLTTDNIKIETSLPIWKIKSVSMLVIGEVRCTTMNAGAGSETSTNILMGESLDITPYILEYGKWENTPIYYPGSGTWAGLDSEYQNTRLYYKRGTRGIFNFNAKQERTALWINQTEFIVNMLIQKACQPYLNKNYPGFWVDDVSAFRQCCFVVSYEALGEHTFLASKSPLQKKIRQVVDNQTNSYININRQGMLEYLKAKRLGNQISLINARYNGNESTIPELAKKINDSIIFRKEIEVHNNFLNVNYQATKGYILRDYFTGVKSKVRSYPIATGSEAFTRCEVIKFYVNNSIPPLNTMSKKIPSRHDLQWYIDNINYCVVRFDTSEGNKPSNIKWKGTNTDKNAYLMEFQKAICGNSVLLTMKCFDNATVGKYITDDKYSLGKKAYALAQQDCSYVDANGECLGGTLYFYKTIYDTNTIDFKVDDNKLDLYLLPAIRQSSTNVVYDDACIMKVPFEIHKDNKEILQITVQIEYNEEANNMFLGKV